MSCDLKETLKTFVAFYERTCHQEEAVKENQMGSNEASMEWGWEKENWGQAVALVRERKGLSGRC